MQYQLVLQFDENLFSYDDMLAFEEKLEKNLEGLADVDGHDFGSGEINFFIISDNPKKIFEKLQSEIIDSNLKTHMRAAYRDIEEEVFFILWPENMAEFRVV